MHNTCIAELKRKKRPLRRIEVNLDESGRAVWLLKDLFLNLKRLHPSQLLVQNVAVKSPSFEYMFENGVWRCQLYLHYPYEQKFDGEATQKRRAEDIACKYAVNWLIESGIVSKNYNLMLKRIDVESALYLPVDINEVNTEIKKEMNNYVDEFNETVLEKLSNELSLTSDERLCYNNSNGNIEDSDCEIICDASSNCEPPIIRDIITGKPFAEPKPLFRSIRSMKLLKTFTEAKAKLEKDAKYRHYKENIASLPIYNHKQEIINMIENNRVTVIAGETACGKTTQIPLFVYEDYVARGNGADCSIVVTQPRRLPAISVAEQVSYQFGDECVGRNIGYQIRFEKQVPNQSIGSMLFCTSGVLLRKLWSNPDMTGITHVFIDEVHERSVVIDFLLVLIKRLLSRNEKLKVILMSATINAELFSKYFDNCPVFEVKGRLFPVNQVYLPQIGALINSNLREPSLTNPKIDKTLIAKVITWIHEEKEEGAILCFLPGWAEISDVRDELLNMKSYDEFYIVLVHSQLPSAQQKLIFNEPPVGKRKIVLSTNLAETSITVPDVVYVIDPGLCKEIHYNKSLDISSFGTHWISRANAKQREGRAGRVKPGYCYKLYSRQTEHYMQEFEEPELRRIPLESVVMLSKFYCPSEKVENFLSFVPQPPPSSAIVAAIETLKSINVLDNNENMTKLGEKIVHFTSHPRLSVCLVYSALFGCSHAMLNFVSAISAPRDIFQVPLDERANIRYLKKQISAQTKSDHVAVSHIIDKFSYYLNEAFDFCRNYSLHFPTMNTIFDLKKLCENELKLSKITEDSSISQKNASQLFNAALLCGLYGNVIRINRGHEVNGVIRNKKVTMLGIKNGETLFPTTDSVVNLYFEEQLTALNAQMGEFMSFAVYFNSYYSLDSKKTNVKDLTLISPLTVLLFAGQQWFERCESNKMNEDPQAVHYHLVSIDNNTYLQFKMKKEDALLLKKWRVIFCRFFEWFLVRDKLETRSSELNRTLSNWLHKFLLLTDKLLTDCEKKS
ncbi:putative ATP-dependent RNA helicase DHX30-like isoform X5 [Leptotrombidium deliense]|uniref:Putative ATP-dependent RNA helicase DHX30-like isoform X5 n=1 Tax=Leptotrombidium deliense TaxID=299467 RepID=A0A443SIZ9_9ACAR|nr:putative ATP-dependent RNA helicase DHX30-like isoform X5 [Leptotrombidium deliense]